VVGGCNPNIDHTVPTQSHDLACRHCAGLDLVGWALACGRPFGPRGSAVPDLTPTPRGPEGEVRNGSAGQQWTLNRPAWGKPREHPSPLPQDSPEVPPHPLPCLLRAHPKEPRWRGAATAPVQAGRSTCEEQTSMRPKRPCREYRSDEEQRARNCADRYKRRLQEFMKAAEPRLRLLGKG
jgi:hypothetical protein